MKRIYGSVIAGLASFGFITSLAFADPVADAAKQLTSDYAASTNIGSDIASLNKALAAQNTPPVLPLSPSGATINAIGAYLVNADGYWSLVSGNRGNDVPPQMISLNDITLPTGAVVLVLVWNGDVYHENSANNWWKSAVGSNGAWVAVPGDPRVAPPSAIAPPPQAVAAGYTTLAFDDEFTSPTTIGSGDTLGPGQKWITPSSSPVGSKKGGVITVANGTLSMSGGAWLQSINWDGTGGFTCAAPGCYLEADIAFPPDCTTVSAPFWTMDVEHLQAWARKPANADQWPGAPSGFTHFGEIDIAERAGGCAVAAGGDGAQQDWFGFFINGQFAKASNNPGFSTDQNGVHIPTNFSNYAYNVATPTQFHKYGWRWISSINGSIGSSTIYVDDQPTTTEVTWVGQPPPYNGTNPGTVPWTFGVFDNHHFPIYMGVSDGGSTQIHWVRAWKKAS